MKINIQKILARAEKIAKKGDSKEAKKLYSEVLKSYPQNLQAKKGHEVLLSKKNLNKDSILSMESVNSIMNLYSNNQSKEALVLIEEIIKDHPNEPILFNIKGACFKALGHLNDAVKAYEAALVIKPDYAEVHYNLGVALKDLLNLEGAVKSYRNAITINPHYPAAHNNLGTTLKELGQMDTAIEHLEWAVAYNRDFADAYFNLGICYHSLNKHLEAIKNYEKALEINPNLFNVNFNLGIVFMELGNVKDAIQNYEKAIDLNPEFARAYLNLTELKEFKKNDPLINKIKSLISSKLLSESDRILLCFALAKINEDLGNHVDFFKYLHEGNSLRKKELNYSIETANSIQSELISLFSKPNTSLDKSILKQKKSKKPIFIVGMPRSGTSLVEQIIASHHGVYGAGELNDLSELIKPIVSKHFLQKNKKIDKKDLISVRQKYLNLLSSLNIEENIVTDKMPLNFRYVGFILSVFPEAKVVHLKRDAMATCWSNYSKYFTNGNGFSFDMNDLSKFYGLYVVLMDFWHKTFPNRIYDISYEDLTINQEYETRQLLEYCQLDWDENCLKFHNSNRSVKTASALQIRKKMYKGSSDNWKKYEKYIQPLIQKLNY